MVVKGVLQGGKSRWKNEPSMGGIGRGVGEAWRGQDGRGHMRGSSGEQAPKKRIRKKWEMKKGFIIFRGKK